MEHNITKYQKTVNSCVNDFTNCLLKNIAFNPKGFSIDETRRDLIFKHEKSLMSNNKFKQDVYAQSLDVVDTILMNAETGLQ